MTYDKKFWEDNCEKHGDQLVREYGGYGGSWRRRIAKAKQDYPDLNWRNKPVSKVEKVRKGICVFDLHHPVHDKKLWANILQFTQDFDPDLFVFGGDNQDLEVISHWVGNKRRRIEGKRLYRDYEKFNSQVLDPLDTILREDTEKVYLFGNHENWVEQYIDEHPEVEGFFEIENNLNLDNWSIVEYGNSYNAGKLHFIHGEYCNLHNAYRTVQVYGRNVIYGHGHTYQAHTITAPLDVQSHTAIQIPCACSLNPHYMKNKPNAWVNGFGVFYIHPNGNFNMFPIIATDGAFIAPNGTFYE